jgi:hypothetical protein
MSGQPRYGRRIYRIPRLTPRAWFCALRLIIGSSMRFLATTACVLVVIAASATASNRHPVAGGEDD